MESSFLGSYVGLEPEEQFSNFRHMRQRLNESFFTGSFLRGVEKLGKEELRVTEVTGG